VITEVRRPKETRRLVKMVCFEKHYLQHMDSTAAKQAGRRKTRKFKPGNEGNASGQFSSSDRKRMDERKAERLQSRKFAGNDLDNKRKEAMQETHIQSGKKKRRRGVDRGYHEPSGLAIL